MAEDSEWVLESVLGFLSGPVWTGPVTDFMDHKCSVFDDDEENKLSYTEIHAEYRQLVEKLLESYLNEIGISEEQFQEACAAPLAHSPELQTVLHPVLAVEDFRMFKAMMVQRNIELQLQAIQIIQERNGVLPDCLQNGTDIVSELEQQEIKLIAEALRISKDEYEKEQQRKVTKERFVSPELEDHKKEVSTGDDKTSTAANRSKGHNARKQPQKLHEHLYNTPTVKLKEMSNTEAAEAWLEQARKEAGIQGCMSSLSKVEKEQLRQRAEYLKQKRDHLLAKKLDVKNTTQAPEDCKEQASSSIKDMTEEEKKDLQKRKHLAEKLKEEVINK
ncbi:cilia- and flagella-associated protein 36 [Spea bombifrons]|uniref:cilia- and flagella-associated protein 36 n=1 Tax=Spea bombifrons TaxID=233779 RepID=UPI00234B078E|nr:cilia- and flagella-associated protein 36 [Spea bombifrons]